MLPICGNFLFPLANGWPTSKKEPMRKTFLLSILCAMTVLAVESCRKDDTDTVTPVTPAQNPTPQYYMRFKIDSVQKAYGGNGNLCNINQADTANGNYYSFIIGRSNASIVYFNQLSITTLDVSQLDTGITYTNYTSTQPNTVSLPNLFSIYYYDENGRETFSFAESLFAPIGLTSDAKLRLSELTPQYARGTFSCTLYDTSFTNPVYVLTDGEFYLPRY
jgi:hypothetical protein